MTYTDFLARLPHLDDEWGQPLPFHYYNLLNLPVWRSQIIELCSQMILRWFLFYHRNIVCMLAAPQQSPHLQALLQQSSLEIPALVSALLRLLSQHDLDLAHHRQYWQKYKLEQMIVHHYDYSPLLLHYLAASKYKTLVDIIATTMRSNDEPYVYRQAIPLNISGFIEQLAQFHKLDKEPDHENFDLISPLTFDECQYYKNKLYQLAQEKGLEEVYQQRILHNLPVYDLALAAKFERLVEDMLRYHRYSDD